MTIGEKMEVHFKDVDGMRPGSAVQMMGMRIGQVEDIEPVINGENSYIVVRFVITEPGIKVPDASKISIQQSGIIGEKFIEVTPPFPEEVYIPAGKEIVEDIKPESRVEIFATDQFKKIGKIRKAQLLETASLPDEEKIKFKTKKVYKIEYFITIPNWKIPRDSKLEIVKNKDQVILRVTPPRDVIVKIPESQFLYTVEEPLRIKDFLDTQLEAALALKETNDRINKLFTEGFIGDIKLTFENTRDITKKTSVIMDQVVAILNDSKEDIKTLITSSTELSKNMTELTNNVNKVIGDPEFKENLITTINSIKVSSDQVSDILSGSKFKESMININSTTKDVAEISKYIKDLTKDENFGKQLSETITNLNTLIINLSEILDTVDNITVEEKTNIKSLIKNSSDASVNLKIFSEKLNKRFLLLRLLF
jgi:ABC-type transporter Mla subunit MlaD